MANLRRFLLRMPIAVAATVFLGCANNQSGTASANANPAATTHSGDDLQRTGKRTSGEALQAADPAVTAPGGH